MSTKEFHDSLRAEFIAQGIATQELLDYIDDRIEFVLSNKMVEYLAQMEEQVEERFRAQIQKT